MPTKQAFIDHLHRLRGAKTDARNVYESRIENVADDDLIAMFRSLYTARTAEIELLDLILLEAEEIK